MKRLMYVLLFVLLAGTSYAQRAKYVFYFIGDGMGVNQVNGTEMYLAEHEGAYRSRAAFIYHIPGWYYGYHIFRHQFSDRFFSSRHSSCHRCKDI